MCESVNFDILMIINYPSLMGIVIIHTRNRKQSAEKAVPIECN